jgi:hypothetical protein
MLPSVKDKPVLNSTADSFNPPRQTMLGKLTNLATKWPPKVPKMTREQQLKLFRSLLFHPLAWVALGLHAALLFMPMGEPKATEAEAEAPETEEAIAVDVLNLSDIATSKPPPPGAPTASNRPAPAQNAAQRSAQPAQMPVPQNPPAQSPPAQAPSDSAAAPAANSVAPVADNSSAGSSVATDNSTAPNFAAPDPAAAGGAAGGAGGDAAAAYDPEADQSVFIANLSAIGLQDYTDDTGLPAPNLFREPNNAGYFLENGQPVANARSARWMNKSPDAVLAQLQESYGPSGITFNQLGDYGGEGLFELSTAEGQSFMFISLVRLKGSTLVVMWQQMPV